MIREQIAHFVSNGCNFEWVVYEHDTPADLKDRLLAYGFEAEDPETIMVLDVEQVAPTLLEPIGHDVRRIDDPGRIDDVVTVRQQVWGGDLASIAQPLARRLTDAPHSLSLYVAYVDGKPASTAQISFFEPGRFAGLVQAATLPAYRGRGLYTALVAIRVQEARRRGIRFLDAEASPMSRPILEKLGFRRLTQAYPCAWHVKHSSPSAPIKELTVMSQNRRISYPEGSLFVTYVGDREWTFEYPRLEWEIFETFHEAIDNWHIGGVVLAEAMYRQLIADYPEFIDAHHHLALLLSQTGREEEAFQIWQEIVALGLDCLPGEFKIGRDLLPWPMIDNRPFLRAYHALGLEHLERGEVEQALEILQTILALNPGDNQGVRALVVDCNLRLNRPGDVLAVCDEYSGDGMEQVVYGRVLALYQLGRKTEAERALRQAIEQLPLVAKELVKERHTPPKDLHPDSVTYGGADQAYYYWTEQGHFWENTAGAIDLVRDCLRKRYHNPEMARHAQELPLRRDMLALLTFVRDNKVVGTQSAGNLPLKAVRQVTARFVDPPQLDTTIGDRIFRLRSEEDVWPLYFLRILADVGGLLATGRARRWRLTPDGERFLDENPWLQVMSLLEVWWHQVNWLVAYPFGGVGEALPSTFEFVTLSRLRSLPINTPISFEEFADGLIRHTRLTWTAEDTDFATKALRGSVKRMVIDILASFGALEREYRDRPLGKGTIRDLAAFEITPFGKALLDAIA